MWWLLVALAVPPVPADEVRVRVEFGAAGDCLVSVDAPEGRARVSYPRRTPAWRCTVPAVAGPPRDTRLEVVLPPGTPRPTGEFPRVRWAERGGRWVGTAALPAPPAFVRVPAPGPVAWWRAVALDLAVLAAAGWGVVWSVRRGRAP